MQRGEEKLPYRFKWKYSELQVNPQSVSVRLHYATEGKLTHRGVDMCQNCSNEPIWTLQQREEWQAVL